MDNPFNVTFVSNLTYPNASDPTFYNNYPAQDTAQIQYHDKYLIIGCALGGFFFILLCLGFMISLRLLKRSREKRKIKEKQLAQLQLGSGYTPEGYPDSKLQHSLFDSSFTIAVQEAAKIPGTPQTAKSDGNFDFGREKGEKA